MKKFILLLVTLFVGTTYSMYYGRVQDRRPLENTQVEVINQSSIPLKLVWFEYDDAGYSGEPITKEIDPDETIVVNLGERGYYNKSNPAKIVYNPVQGNEKFELSFTIDLPSSNRFVIISKSVSEILDSVQVPGVFKADEDGNLSSFQYMNLDKWERSVGHFGSVKTIQY